jgi:hypothetical protein
MWGPRWGIFFGVLDVKFEVSGGLRSAFGDRDAMLERKDKYECVSSGYLGEDVPICEAQGVLKPECTSVHEDFKTSQQRSRWVRIRPNTYTLNRK